jgi:acylphosphatase
VPERRFHVHGRVQGVGFRWWTLAQAQRLGIAGTVRNREDGSVEVLARGTGDQLAQLRQLLERGPDLAEVRSVDEAEANGVTGDDFQIVHR